MDSTKQDKWIITINEFISAIAIGCPFQYSYEHYINALMTVSPKNKNELWINFCKILRKSDEPVLRGWRIWAHKLFMSRVDEIEREFMRRTHYMNDPANSHKILKYLYAAAQDKVMTENELESLVDYLHDRGYLESENDIRNNDSGSQYGAGGSSRVSIGEAPGTSGQTEDNRSTASNNASEKEQRSVDVSQVGPEKLCKIMSHLYEMTGMALAHEKATKSTNRSISSNKKAPNVPKETCSQSSASSVIRPTQGSSKTLIIPTILSTITRINKSSGCSDNLLPSIIVTEFDEEEEKKENEKTVKASSKSQNKTSAPSKS